jgi:asparagine synthase (glutamine-hydrolysing)
MDSSSIVCMADLVIAGGQAHCPRLDTISWFDDSYDHVEPDSNELHWISKVEEKRNRPGFHINLRELKANDDHSQRHFTSEFDNDHFAATPTPNRPVSEHFSQYAAHMKSQGHRVVLAGIGGDEVTGGGVPTPRPELQNLLVRARFFTLARQLKAWAARMRTPRIPLLWQAARPFLARSVTGAGTPKHVRPAPWFYRGFIRQNHAALYGYPSRVKFFGPLPSFQENVTTLEVLRRTFVSLCLYPEFCRELRYPYLDRDLLEFIYAVPREQIVRVGQRRSLMKRSLVNIVPDELLSRKRKAFVRQEPEKDSSTEWPSLAETGRQIVGSSVGIIDPNRFWEALQKARRNEEVPIDSLRKTLTLESWLRHLTVQEVLRNPLPKRRTVILRPLRALAQRFEGQRGTLLSTLGIKKSPASAQPTVQLASSWKAKTTKERR